MKTESYMVCTDCYEVLGTGDATSLDYHYPGSAAIDKLNSITQGADDILSEYTDGYISAGDKKDSFSRQSCECCGSALHGARYELLVLYKG